MSRRDAPPARTLLVSGAQGISQDDVRYPIMLQVFLADETLPHEVRATCRTFLEHHARKRAEKR